jgi:hypothetical protein
MKKILFCLIAFLTMSCTCNSDTHNPKLNVAPLSYGSDIDIVEIEGHLYIVYMDEFSGGSGICHAEHCPCRNNNLK